MGRRLYAHIRSIVETARRRSVRAIDAIRLTLKGQPIPALHNPRVRNGVSNYLSAKMVPDTAGLNEYAGAFAGLGARGTDLAHQEKMRLCNSLRQISLKLRSGSTMS